MKSIFKSLALVIIGIAVVGNSAASIFAQDDCDATYEKFRNLYKQQNLEDKKQALELARKYVADKNAMWKKT